MTKHFQLFILIPDDRLVLAVFANGSAVDDQAVWVNPRVINP
jgi:hypothetical protein